MPLDSSCVYVYVFTYLYIDFVFGFCYVYPKAQNSPKTLIIRSLGPKALKSEALEP